MAGDQASLAACRAVRKALLLAGVIAAGACRAQDMIAPVLDGTGYIPSAARAESLRMRGDCIRVTLASGDRVPFDAARGRPYERSELISQRKIPFGVPVTVSFSQYVVPGPLPSVPTIVGQFHNSAHPGQIPLSPPFAFEIDKDGAGDGTGGGVQRIVTRDTTDPYPSAPPRRNIRWTGPLVMGEWVAWRITAVFDPSGGMLRVFRDGVAVFDQPIPLGYNDPVGPYWQFGIYRPSAPESLDILYANMRETIGQDALAPSTVPPPPPVDACPAPR